MVETVRYSKAMLEDLALGYSTRSVRMADQAVRVLHEISLAGLLAVVTKTLAAASFSGTALMTWAAAIPANARVWGVTSKCATAFGVTGGLASVAIGEPADSARWGTALPITLNAETDQGDFTTSDLPIYPIATDVWVSALGGTFDATGTLELAVFYSLLRHPS